MDKVEGLTCAIDANSLRILAQYFLPFDEEGEIRNFIRSSIKDEKLVLLKRIRTEVGRVPELVGNGGLLQGLPVQGRRILNKSRGRIETTWTDPAKREKISPEKMARKYRDFLRSGDYQLLAYCIDERAKCPWKKYAIVTEESRKLNDGKLFMKIPRICELEKIDCIDLVTFLQMHGLRVNYRIHI